MNLIEELDAMKNRIIQEVNTEFERLAERMEQENVQVLNRERERAYESIYPLTTDSNIFTRIPLPIRRGTMEIFPLIKEAKSGM